MLVLALDTSTRTTTVAVAVSVDVAEASGSRTRVLAEHADDAPNRHGEVLAPLVDRALRDAGAARADIGLVAVGVGPGPFTGLRVGLVTALGLADALGVPVRGVCSLDAVAAHVGRPWPDGFAVAADARRKEVYWATYRDGRRTSGPAVGAPADVAAELDPGMTVVGAGAVLYADVFGARRVDGRAPEPSAGDLAALACDEQWVVPAQPMYLRRPDARPPGAPKKVTRA
ncbi:MAG TPA: tRNA (adenosine(37)-N6)-threonylcarbamoyltransferase complex dimerization subunit type 1 TsaB [Mycobacteriales bacterium]|nr:tRNA (adenosine(37)-N6)-threonylcarbamoyltransferase complex dimerization subunit type 1 TsaB [Mycobacteriales bacterium]